MGSAGRSGLYLQQYNFIMAGKIRMAGELESDSVALERVREYEELPQVNLLWT